ncbi:MAG: hypothetical protein ACWGQW_02960 [bacterium]
MPIYRYKCTKCKRIREVTAPLSEGAPPDYVCRMKYVHTYIPPVPVELGVDPAEPDEPEFYETECGGTMKRIYDTFQFHISGR